MIQRIIELLQRHGHEVQRYFKDSSDIPSLLGGKARAFFSGVYSYKSRREIRLVLRSFRPDLVQIQNLFPLISPSILPQIKSHGVPIVMRISNYRLVCPNGLFLSHGSICQRCRSGREYWCALRNCENSIFKSLGYALRSWVARKMRLFLDNVTFYYAQTNFQKKCLVEEGFSENKISIIPNMVDGSIDKQNDTMGSYVGYAGRISPEKGLYVLTEAARSCSSISFKIAGSYQRMPELLSKAPDNMEFFGHLNTEAIASFYQDCRIFVLPTICFDGFPGVLIEAMLRCTPVVCSKIGGLPDIVEDGKTGLLFEPGNSEELTKKIKYLWERPDLCAEMGALGREKALKEYSPEAYYRRLMKVYETAIKYENSATRGAIV